MTCHKFKLERKLTKEEAAVALSIGKELEDFVVMAIDVNEGDWTYRANTAFEVIGEQETVRCISDGELSVWLFSEKERI